MAWAKANLNTQRGHDIQSGWSVPLGHIHRSLFRAVWPWWHLGVRAFDFSSSLGSQIWTRLSNTFI